MPIMMQVYEYRNDGKPIRRGTTQSIFSSMEDTIRAKHNEFWVINDFGVTPDVGGCYLQFRLGVTNYFRNPNESFSNGICGKIIPYPQNSKYQNKIKIRPFYVLPGQVIDVSLYNSKKIWWGQNIRAFIKYDVYDGPEAYISVKLLAMGCAVNPKNVEWYHKLLFQNNKSYMGG